MGLRGRECQSPTWQETQACPRAGDDGGGCSPFSAERDSSRAAGLGGRIAVIKSAIGGDRIGDQGRSIRDRLPKPGQALVLECGPEGGNRLPPGFLRAGTGAKSGGRRSVGAGPAGFRVLGQSNSGRIRLFRESGQLAAAERLRRRRRAIAAMIGRPCSCCSWRC